MASEILDSEDDAALARRRMLSIAFLGIIADRIIDAWTKKREEKLGLS